MNIHVVALVNFPEQLNYASTLNAREVMKFYNLGDQSLKQTLILFSPLPPTGFFPAVPKRFLVD